MMQPVQFPHARYAWRAHGLIDGKTRWQPPGCFAMLPNIV